MQIVSQSEKDFLLDGIRQGVRTDGRGLMECRDFTIHTGTVPESFGSCTLVYGQENTQIVCAIKTDTSKPQKSEPNKGQINFYLESSQTGRSLFVREDTADQTKNQIQHIIQNLYANIIDRTELCIFKGEFCWNLNVDILIFDELQIQQIDYICHAIRGAFQDLKLPQTIATMNNNTQKIEVGLVEEIYTDKENTDTQIMMISAKNAPFVISIGLIIDENNDQNLPTLPLLDATLEETLCLDQILHVAVTQGKNDKLMIHSIFQSKGEASYAPQSCMAGLPAGLFIAKNFGELIKGRLSQLTKYNITEQ